MKRTVAIIAGAVVIGLSAAGFARSLSDKPEAFGISTQTIDLEDVRLDAEATFAEVDMDQDGFVSLEEYAGQAVVTASLARFNGAVVIDGRKTYYIALPEGVGGPVSSAERTAIDAVARARYQYMAGDDQQMDSNEWVAARLSEFASIDFDSNGLLDGREIDVFAMSVARFPLSVV